MNNTVKWFWYDRYLVLRHKDTNIVNSPVSAQDIEREPEFLHRQIARFVAGEDVPPLEYISVRSLERARDRLFRLIPAAGGVVFDPQGQVLLIRRFDRWDLPKGKAEPGEDIRDTAVREVTEECGLDVPPLIEDFLTDTWHIYPHKGGLVLKQTSWFRMKLLQPGRLRPQQEEGISEVRWMSPGEAAEASADVYASLKEVFVCSGIVNS
jgi:8-oxo-dGTP pyrophosphatase MutT (NUDIX family)